MALPGLPLGELGSLRHQVAACLSFCPANTGAWTLIQVCALGAAAGWVRKSCTGRNATLDVGRKGHGPWEARPGPAPRLGLPEEGKAAAAHLKGLFRLPETKAKSNFALSFQTSHRPHPAAAPCKDGTWAIHFCVSFSPFTVGVSMISLRYKASLPYLILFLFLKCFTEYLRISFTPSVLGQQTFRSKVT